MAKYQFSDGVYEVKKGDKLTNGKGFITVVVSTWGGLRTFSGLIPKDKTVKRRKII